MNAPKRSRARVLTPEGLQKLRERVRSHEVKENAGFKYTLERLGELTGLDPETVKNVLDCKGSDKRTIARCFESFGLTLAESDHIPATQATATADPNFVGRDEAIADLDTLVSRNARVIVIQARGGVGKTTLARKYLQQEFGSFLEFPIAKETKDIASIEGLLEEKLRQLGEEPGREFLVSLDRLKRKLQAERIGILIDNLEPALDSAGKFIEAHRRYVELLRVLSDPIVQSMTLITSRERLREADVTVQHYPLRSLSVQAWSQFFQSRSINTDTPALATLHDAYGGNAKAMDIISGTVLEDFSGDVEAYWQVNQSDLFIERDLEDLVIKQFNRLQELDPDAYKLLCRMGCYRYQDVPTVPIEGLFCLLWDVPENRHRRVIRSLQDRSLVDFENGEFWLHPVVREEAITRLRLNENLEMANRKAAEFWTESIEVVETISDAKIAFEPYHHYLEINDFDLACNVIIHRRIGGNRLGARLGSIFYRLGLSQQIITEIQGIFDKVNLGFPLGKLINILGDQYWAIGQVHEAIKSHNYSREIATQCLQKHEVEAFNKLIYRLKRLEILADFNIGICKIELWELEEAIQLFEKFVALMRELIKILIDKPVYDGDEVFSANALVNTAIACLSFLYSCLNNKTKALHLAEKSYIFFSSVSDKSWNDLIGLVFLGSAYNNLKQYDKSLSLYQEAISLAEEKGFRQIKVRATYGLGTLSRNRMDFNSAVSFHSEAVKLAQVIGAKFDWAEASFQLGITQKMIKDESRGHENLQRAIDLFTQIEAPKQVERVRQSMQN